MSGSRTFQVSVADGVTLDCVERGSRTGTPLLLVHGYSDSRHSYEPLMAELTDIRAIAVTLRGHGDSSKPESRYAADELAGDLAVVLDHLGISRAIVAGHSMGSMVARRLALDCPQRIQGLVLIGAFAIARNNGAVAQLREEIAGIADPVDRAFVQAFQESTLARPVAPRFLETIVAESLKLPAMVWRRALQGMIDDDSGEQLHRVAAPALVIWGDRDAICDRAAQSWLCQELANVRLSVHEGAGHAPHWEDPKRVATEITEFVGQILDVAA